MKRRNFIKTIAVLSVLPSKAILDIAKTKPAPVKLLPVFKPTENQKIIFASTPFGKNSAYDIIIKEPSGKAILKRREQADSEYAKVIQKYHGELNHKIVEACDNILNNKKPIKIIL